MSRRGSALEVRLSAMHQTYLAAGVARVHKAHPEAKDVGGRIVYSSKGPPDFIGTLTGGRSVAFDAKESTRSPKFRLDLVPQHQAKDLEAHANLGGLSMLIVSTTAGQWAVPWATVAERYWTQAGSLTPAELDEVGRRLDERCDWLAVVGGW